MDVLDVYGDIYLAVRDKIFHRALPSDFMGFDHVNTMIYVLINSQKWYLFVNNHENKYVFYFTKATNKTNEFGRSVKSF